MCHTVTLQDKGKAKEAPDEYVSKKKNGIYQLTFKMKARTQSMWVISNFKFRPQQLNNFIK